MALVGGLHSFCFYQLIPGLPPTPSSPLMPINPGTDFRPWGWGSHPWSFSHGTTEASPLHGPSVPTFWNSPSMSGFVLEGFRLPAAPEGSVSGVLVSFCHSQNPSFIHSTILIIFPYGRLSRHWG